MIRTIPLVVVTVLCACSPPTHETNLLFVTFDTTRADALSIYGNDRIRMPALEGLAEEGVVFERAFTAAPVTLPSHSSMMTGRHPFNHGVRDNGVFILEPGQTTLAEILHEAGWSTGAAVGSFPLTAQFGIDQGFEFFDDEVEPSPATMPDIPQHIFFDERPAGRVNSAALDWLQDRGNRPFFLWIHYFDPHHPLQAPPPFSEIYSDPYLAEIAYADENLGFLLAEIDRLGETDQTVVVVAGDHGEGRGQHREETHSILAYDSTLHVPLVIKVPGGSSGRRVATPVGLVDILPTLADVMDFELPVEVDGRSLASALSLDQPDPEPVPLYSEALSPRVGYGWGELRSLRRDAYKYIHGPRPELFNIESDPDELRSLMSEQPSLGAEMRQHLEDFLTTNDRAISSVQQEVGAETLAKLEALGYLHGGGDDSAIEETLTDGGIPPQDKVHLINHHANIKNFLHTEQYSTARALAQDLVNDHPETPLYRRHLATAELRLQLYDSAIDHLIVLLDVDVSDTERGEATSLLNAIELTTARAMKMLGSVERSEALKPTTMGQYLTARCLFELGQADEGEEALRRALVIDPRHNLSKVYLGTWLVSDHREFEGRALLEEAAGEEPYSVRALTALGDARRTTSDPEGAREVYERVLELQPDNTEVMRTLLFIYIATDRETEARELLETLQTLVGSPLEDLTKHVENRWPSS